MWKIIIIIIICFVSGWERIQSCECVHKFLIAHLSSHDDQNVFFAHAIKKDHKKHTKLQKNKLVVQCTRCLNSGVKEEVQKLCRSKKTKAMMASVE